MKRFLRVVPFFLAFCLLISVCIRGESDAAPEDPVVAVVGDYTITEGDIKRYIANVRSAQNIDVPAEKALNELVSGSILFQEAKKRKIHERKDIREKIDTFIKNTMIGQILSENVKPGKPITDEDAKKLYEQNWKDSHYPRAANLSCVFVEYRDSSNAADAEKYAGLVRKQMAETGYENTKEFLNELQQKFPLPEGVKLNFKDVNDMLLTSFAKFQSLELKVASSFKEGEVTEVMPMNVTGRQLYAVYKKTKENPRFEAPFNKVKSELMMNAAELMYNEEVNAFVGELRKNYPIEYKKDVKSISLQ